MNKTYRLIWSDICGTWVAVAEFTRSHGKRAGSLLLMAAATSALAAPPNPPPPTQLPTQLPTGGSIVAGQASIGQSGATLNIDQSSPRAALDWRTFNVGSAATVNFRQPTNQSVTLNRIQDGNPSQIFGRINANGQVFLTNPNGFYFAPGASVNVGALVATTHSLSLEDFMAGKAKFQRLGATGSILNEGELTAALGGYIALLAPEVRNQGVIVAQMGTVALAAGEAFELQFDANNTLAGLLVEPSTIKALVENANAVLAPGGLIILSAQAVDRLQGGVVRNSGQLEATGLHKKGGRIVLEASDRIENSGSIEVSATGDSPSGQIELHAHDIINSGTIIASGLASTPGGQVHITAAEVVQTDSGQIDLSAAEQGGTLSITADHTINIEGTITVAATATQSSLQARGGDIELHAGGSITLNNAHMDASGTRQGGHITLQAATATTPDPSPAPPNLPGQGQLTLLGNTGLTVRSRYGQGGDATLLGTHIVLADNTHMDASGANGGGKILIGGDWQGSGNLPQATSVIMAASARIDASATQNGEGGKVVLWSDVHHANSQTTASGSILARGGVNGGNGGRVETSGHKINIDGIRVNAGADKGTGGLWLIDPYNYTIGSAQAATIVGSAISGLNSGTSIMVDTSGDDSSQGSSGNIANAGDITVTAAIAKSLGGDATLTLKAARHIVLQSGANFSSSSGKLNLQFWADSDNSGDGINMVSATSIATNGGWIKFGNNQTANINGSNVLVGGDVFFNSASAQTLSTGGGSLNVYGETILANSSGVTINTGGGNVAFSGVLNSGNQYSWVDKTSDTNHDWNWARNDAKNGTAGGSAVGNSYLVTITSRLENAIAGLTAGYRGAWIGAYRANPTSSFAWTWSDGPEAGQQFFMQNSSGGGGTTTTGYYSNYGSGEPNGTLAGNESVGQFFGTTGQWNDLSPTTIFSATQIDQYAVLGYVRETNLAPTTLTINAGSGTVTIDGGVGSSKALASFTVNAASTTINGSALVTTGAQSYDNALTVNSSGNLNIAASTLTIINANQNLLFKAAGNIIQAADTSLSTNGGNIIYWADSDHSDQGYVALHAGDNLVSNGGKIVLAGGLDDGSHGGTASDGIPDGYAMTNVNAAASQDYTAGVSLGQATATGTSVNLLSSGGDIIVHGGNTSATTGVGITSQGSFKIDSGTGTITLLGQSNSGHGVELTFSAVPSYVITSANTSANAIDIEGTSDSATGLWLGNNTSGNILIQATGAGGGITLKGTTVSGYGLLLTRTGETTQIIANSGPINLSGYASSSTNDFVSDGYLYLGNRKDGTTINGVTPAITTSSSDITLSGDTFTFGSTANISSSGAFTLQPYGNDFSAAYTIQNLTLASSLTGLTIGKSATSADGTSDVAITISTTQNIAGPISIYGGNINLDSSLTSTASGAAILLNATGNIYSTSTSGNPIVRTIITNNGNISLIADADANGAGILNLDYTILTAGSGNVVVRGETMSWDVGVGQSPTITSTTGTFTFESSDASFGQGVDTGWLILPTTLSALTVGKGTNTQNVSVSTNALSVAGPVNIYGDTVTLNNTLSTTDTNTGNIAITASTGLTGSAGISLADGRILTVDQAGASTYSGTISGTGSSLTKTGAGTLTLAGTSSYNDATNIAMGTLALTGSLSTSTHVVMSGSAIWDLQVNQTIAGLTMAAGNSITNSTGASSLAVTGAATLANSLTTSGSQTYGGAVTLIANTQLTTTDSDITFNSTVDSADAAHPKSLTTTINPGTHYYWVDWTSADTNHVYGTITIGSDVINVTYTNASGYSFAQTTSGTNYWTGYVGASFVGASPYVSAKVANGPTGWDIIALRYAGAQTLAFSQSIENLAFSIVSMNGNGYGFNQDFTIQSYSGYNGAGPGYFGSGNMVKAVTNGEYQLNDGGINASSVGGNSEPHGTIRFNAAFDQLTWNSLSNENWNAFTVGVTGTSASAGKVHFNGIAGGTASLGAVTINAGLQTTANISDASSLSVTGRTQLGGNITTSGDQSYASAITLNTDATLTTTGAGNVTTTSSVDGAHVLTINNSGTGNTQLNGAVGATAALTGLSITTNVLTAGDIALAASGVIEITNADTSEITGVISGSGATLTKAGSGTLTMIGASTYSGGTSVNAGVLQAGVATTGSVSNGPFGTGAVTVNSGAAVDVNGKNIANAFTISGSGISGSGALFNSTSTAAALNGAITLATDATINSTAGANLTLGGPINGGHGLTVTTAGSGDGTYTQNGTIGATTALTSYTVNSGAASISLAGATNVTGQLTLHGGAINLWADLTSTATTGTGISINGSSIAQTAGVDVATSGANIDYLVANAAFTANTDSAINLYGASGNHATINAGGGNVTLDAAFAASGTAGDGDDAVQAFYTDISTTGSGTISITGDATNIGNSSTNAWGMFVGYSTIRTDSGAINITGIGGHASNNSLGIVVNGTDLKILSSAGAITLTDPTPSGLTGSYGGMYLNPSASAHIMIGADGSTVPSSTSNITIRADKANFIANGAYGTQLNTAGAVVVESHAAAFGSTANLTNLAISGSPSSVRIGKTTNTADITLGGITAAGPINIYGGNIYLNANLSSSGAGGSISLIASDSILGSNGSSITTAGAGILLSANSDGLNGGAIMLDRMTISSHGGNITLGGGTDGSGYAEGSATSYTYSVSWLVRHRGIWLNQTTLNASGGNVALRGKGWQGANNSASGQYAIGIDILEGSLIETTGNGSVTLEGIGGNNYDSNTHAVGINLYTGVTANTISTEDGALNIQGTAAPSGSGRSASKYAGINFDGGTANMLSTGGNITLTGNVVSTGFGLLNGLGSANIGDIHTTGDIVLNSDSFSLPNATAIVTTGHLTLQSVSASFSSTLALPSTLSLAGTISALTLGKSGNTADININYATSIAGPINIYGGNIAINDVLTATGTNTITLQGSGNVTDSAGGHLSADKLALLGGNVVLDNTANAIGTLAASGIGSLTYVDSDALIIGSVNPNGITATGPVSISTISGDLTVTQNISTTDASTSALVLNAGSGESAGTATGGNIILSGNPTITIGSGGTAKLYTGSLSGSSGLGTLVGSGSGHFRYNSDETTNFATGVWANLGTGIYGIYREQPTITAVTVGNQAITYGDAIPGWVFSLTGSQNGDTLAQAFTASPTVTIGGSTSTSGNYTAGSHLLTASGSLGSSRLGYAYSSNYHDGTLTISQKTLNVSYSGINKIYDGSLNATVTTGDDRITNDVLSLARTAAFVDKNANNGVTVNVTGVSLSNTDAANYTLASTTGSTTADITKKTVSLSASKTYDGTTDLTGDVSITTGIGSETLSYTGATASNAHVATANKYINAMTLADGSNGGLADNYQLPALDAANAPVTINTKALTATATIVGTLSRDYDGTAAATGASISGTVIGAVSGDTLTLDSSGVTLAYNSAHVAYANRIAVSSGSAGFAIDSSSHGSQTGDYSLSAPTITSVTANITQATLSPTLTNSGITKTYDGTLDAPAGFTPTWNYGGLVSGDTAASLASTSTSYNSKDVTSATTLTLFGLSITGISGSNASLPGDYELDASSKNAAANISAKAVTVSGLVVANKIYDGSDAASVTDWGSVNTGVGSETLALAGTQATFDNANAGNNKIVTATAYSLANGSNGGLASNYLLSATSPTTTADIAKATLTITANNDARFLTQSEAATYSGISYSGFVHGESAATASNLIAPTVSRSARGPDGNTGAASTLAGTYTNQLMATGGGADNYTLAYLPGTYTIVPSNQLLIRVSDPGSLSYGSAANYTIASAQYWDPTANSGNGAAVSLPGITANGNNNFTIADGFGGTATFTLAALSAVTTGAGKLAAGSYQLGISGTVAENSANFSNTLTIIGSTSISQKALTPTAGNVSKIYDGTTAATDITLGFSGLVSGDTVTASGSGLFNQKNAGSHLGYTISGLTLGGSDYGNYYLSGGTSISGNNGEITPRPLTVSGITANNKTFDGTPSATVSTTNAMFNGLISGDEFLLSATGTFSDKNAGRAKTVYLSSSYSGADQGNYAITDQATTTADITGIPDVIRPPTPSQSPAVADKPQEQTGLNGGILQSGEAALLDTLDINHAEHPANSANIDTPATNNGLTVELMKPPTLEDTGLVVVEVPQEILLKGFSFVLPKSLTEGLTNEIEIVATLADGNPLPSWLKFRPASRTFTATQAADGALPIQVMIKTGKKRILLTISLKNT